MGNEDLYVSERQSTKIMWSSYFVLKYIKQKLARLQENIDESTIIMGFLLYNSQKMINAAEQFSKNIKKYHNLSFV